MRDIFDELMDYLCSAEISQWNMKRIANDFVELKKYECGNATIGNYTDLTCPIGISDQDYEKMSFDEISYLNKIFNIYQLTDTEIDWPTNHTGTFFVKTVSQYPSIGIDEINDAFTPTNVNVSWPDIALMYNLKDFRILTEHGNKLNTPAKYLEVPCADYDIWCSPTTQRYSSFQSCFDEVLNYYQPDDITTFRKEDKMDKAIQPSPCHSFENFKNCSEYCAWHNNFLETIGQEELIQVMSYASPQRKVYKESIPIEKKIAGTVRIWKKEFS